MTEEEIIKGKILKNRIDTIYGMKPKLQEVKEFSNMSLNRYEKYVQDMAKKYNESPAQIKKEIMFGK